MTYRPNLIVSLLLAGVLGELVFEAYAWLISPLIFGLSLQPANLVMALAGQFANLSLPYATAFVIHVLIGSLGFATVILLTKRVTGLGCRMAGALVGLGLWFVAQGILAPLIGRDFMMGFGAYTQSSSVAHVGMALVIGAVLQARLGGGHLTKRRCLHAMSACRCHRAGLKYSAQR
ncbi:hypothetical protein [Roseobacter weihaiensis]|uniref:hypothetical protein n=1 Tax=Roseobacter weihaiensis TaxID=2763262 RepID=UPI001D0AD4D8|nr:hypothetical protein [Roseobacter sp. H9]